MKKIFLLLFLSIFICNSLGHCEIEDIIKMLKEMEKQKSFEILPQTDEQSKKVNDIYDLYRCSQAYKLITMDDVCIIHAMRNVPFLAAFTDKLGNKAYKPILMDILTQSSDDWYCIRFTYAHQEYKEGNWLDFVAGYIVKLPRIEEAYANVNIEQIIEGWASDLRIYLNAHFPGRDW